MGKKYLDGEKLFFPFVFLPEVHAEQYALK